MSFLFSDIFQSCLFWPFSQIFNPLLTYFWLEVTYFFLDLDKNLHLLRTGISILKPRHWSRACSARVLYKCWVSTLEGHFVPVSALGVSASHPASAVPAQSQALTHHLTWHITQQIKASTFPSPPSQLPTPVSVENCKFCSRHTGNQIMEPRYKDKGCSLSCVLQYYLQSQFLIVKA